MKLITAFSAAAFIAVSSAQRTSFPPAFCGNGRIDPGEQCDPSDPSISSDCCDNSCRLLPPSTACSNGLGVCTPSGNCTTRALVCSAFNGNLLRLSSSNGQPSDTVGGPFGVCYTANARSGEVGEENRSIQSLIESKSVSGGSVLANLLPASYLAQSQCLTSCSGNSLNQSSQSKCIDFAKYQNLPALAPDYLGCVVDRTSGVDYFSLVAANPSDRELENRLAQPGVCVTGVCRPDICRSIRCSGHGECGLAGGALRSIKQGLGLAGGSNMVTQEPALVRCYCDNGFFGDMCQYTGNVTGSNSK